jgi:hypothetical protein
LLDWLIASAGTSLARKIFALESDGNQRQSTSDGAVVIPQWRIEHVWDGGKARHGSRPMRVFLGERKEIATGGAKRGHHGERKGEQANLENGTPSWFPFT